MRTLSLSLTMVVGAVCANPALSQNKSLVTDSTTELSKTAITIDQKLFEEALAWRAQVMTYYQANHRRFEKDANLSHEDLEDIYRVSSRYLDLRARVLNLIESNKIGLSNLQEVVFSTQITTRIVDEWDMGLEGQTKRVLYINPLDAAGAKAIHQLKQSIASTLVMFDSYQLGITPYLQHKKIRQLLNRDYPGQTQLLDQVVYDFVSPGNRWLIKMGIEVLKDEKEFRIRNGLKQPPLLDYLDLLMEQSPSWKEVSKNGTLNTDFLKFWTNKLMDRLSLSFSRTTYATSMVFGNAMGLVQSRSGLMKNLSEVEKDQISRQLQPMDVLLEKTPFRLTDTFIPGYYGHVAIWTGDESQLRALGVWDHPAVVPYQKMIQDGHRIIEALRPGVQINTLNHFLDIDDLLAIRKKHVSFDTRREEIIRAFQQVGKEYDFNFDVETDKRIVCSEIAYVVFHDIKWPTDKAMGRFTISPDHVAWQAAPGNPFEPIVIYKEGKQIQGNLSTELMNLIAGPEGIKNMTPARATQNNMQSR